MITLRFLAWFVVLNFMSLQHCVAVGDSASGLADRGGVFQLSGDHTPQPPWESLF